MSTAIARTRTNPADSYSSDPRDWPRPWCRLVPDRAVFVLWTTGLELVWLPANSDLVATPGCHRSTSRDDNPGSRNDESRSTREMAVAILALPTIHRSLLESFEPAPFAQDERLARDHLLSLPALAPVFARRGLRPNHLGPGTTIAVSSNR